MNLYERYCRETFDVPRSIEGQPPLAGRVQLCV